VTTTRPCVVGRLMMLPNVDMTNTDHAIDRESGACAELHFGVKQRIAALIAACKSPTCVRGLDQIVEWPSPCLPNWCSG